MYVYVHVYIYVYSNVYVSVRIILLFFFDFLAFLNILLIPFYFIFQPQPPFCMQCEVLALAVLFHSIKITIEMCLFHFKVKQTFIEWI